MKNEFRNSKFKIIPPPKKNINFSWAKLRGAWLRGWELIPPVSVFGRGLRNGRDVERVKGEGCLKVLVMKTSAFFRKRLSLLVRKWIVGELLRFGGVRISREGGEIPSDKPSQPKPKLFFFLSHRFYRIDCRRQWKTVRLLRKKPNKPWWTRYFFFY